MRLTVHTSQQHSTENQIVDLYRVEIKKKNLLCEKITKYFPMLCAKRMYDCDMIINKCPKFYDLKKNKRYNFFYEI